MIGIPIAKVLPNEDDGKGVTAEELIGNIAVISTGNATKTLMAEAKIEHSELGTHYVQILIDPDCDNNIATQGTLVSISSYLKGKGHYYAIPLDISTSEAFLTTERYKEMMKKEKNNV